MAIAVEPEIRALPVVPGGIRGERGALLGRALRLIADVDHRGRRCPQAGGGELHVPARGAVPGGLCRRRGPRLGLIGGVDEPNRVGPGLVRRVAGLGRPGADRRNLPVGARQARRRIGVVGVEHEGVEPVAGAIEPDRLDEDRLRRHLHDRLEEDEVPGNALLQMRSVRQEDVGDFLLVGDLDD
ncbi:MAG TPA: hypothetical protein VLJ20_13500, partial [Acetobacteraceae bacterium]|nr:hypothetical protein [Acetobacteraceae bacterium]